MLLNCRRGLAAVIVSKDETQIYVCHGNIGGHETGNHATSLAYLDRYTIASDSWTALSDAPKIQMAVSLDGQQ